jgi:2-phospho-L-lactate guanylyltransferase
VPVVAILPVKSFHLGKGRLAGILDSRSRMRLGVAFAARTVETAEAAGLLPLLVAGDHEVGKWALRRAIPFVPDPGRGLSEAARQGVIWAGHSSSRWLVLHSDLPLLSRADLAALAAPLDGGESVIAPSADAGTSAIGSLGEFGFSYGPGSFPRHLARLPDAKVISRVGLLHDVDSPEDLLSASRHPRGQWLSEFVP